MSSITLHGVSLYLGNSLATALRPGALLANLRTPSTARERLLDLADDYAHSQSSYAEDLRASAGATA
jgi:hypothetical protein